MSNTVTAHGGQLIQRIVSKEKRSEWLDRASTLPKLVVSEATASDILCIANGAFSPLEGFMNPADYYSVLQEMRLEDGTIWSLPIVLPVPEDRVNELKKSTHLVLYRKEIELLAVMELESLYSVDRFHEANRVFQTTNSSHPGVARLYQQSSIYAGGKIWLVSQPNLGKSQSFAYSPKETRRIFAEKGWKKIVGFQTRNPVHRAHEYIQKAALETVDGLFLHPLVGETKTDDVPVQIRLKSYQVLLEKYYPQDRVLLGVFPAAMRYAGPREAIFHAVVRKNYGCTHFIVGRDHAGVGDFYGTYDAQKIFDQFSEAELDITPLFFEHSFYCKKCESMSSFKTCPHGNEEHITLSGTKVREMLRKGQKLPSEFTRPEVANVLIEGFCEEVKL